MSLAAFELMGVLLPWKIHYQLHCLENSVDEKFNETESKTDDTES